MSPEFFGEPLNVKNIVDPLVAASDECLDKCDGIDTEYAFACRDAVDNSGYVYVVACPNYVEGECSARRVSVGEVTSNGEFRAQGGYMFNTRIAKIASEEFGVDQDYAEKVLDGSSGITSLLFAINEHRFKEIL